MASLYFRTTYFVYWWQMSPYVELRDHGICRSTLPSRTYTVCHYLGYLLGHHFHKYSILHQQVLACLLHEAKERNQTEQVDSCTAHA